MGRVRLLITTAVLGSSFTHLTEVVLIDTKPQVQLSGVILQNPLQRVVIFTVLQNKQR